VSTCDVSDVDTASSLSSSLGGTPVDGTLEGGLLLAVLMGMPKKEFRGETRPGDVWPGVAAEGGARNMFVTMLPGGGISDAERRW
jgi:hypothetical protein